jgi:hypothetical protein
VKIPALSLLFKIVPEISATAILHEMEIKGMWVGKR